MRPRSKVWIELDGRYLMGDGRAELLSAIARLGSISEAARQIGISYRHAWGYIKKIEERSGTRIVETTRGGKGGGSAKLTGPGKDLLEKYRRFREGVGRAIAREYTRHFGKGKTP